MTPLRAELVTIRLHDLGIATPEQLAEAQQELGRSQERFSLILVRLGLLRDGEAGVRLASQLGSMPQPLGDPPSETTLGARVPAALWRTHRLIPVREEAGRLLVATDDPLSVYALDFFAGQCGGALEAVLIPEGEFKQWLKVAGQSSAARRADPAVASPAAVAAPRSGTPAPAAPTAQSVKMALAPTRVAPASQPRSTVPAGTPQAAHHGTPGAVASGDDDPMIRLVDSMLEEAVRVRASDVHLESTHDALRVRYRIDGVLRDVTSPSKSLHGPVVSRIKIMAGLNIAEKRLPQDGRLQMTIENRPLDVRVSVLPSMHGEAVVMRLLDRSQPMRGLRELGLLEGDQQRWDALIHRPHGMVLATGPTGSGKTTTLYGALATLNQPDRKLITIEDPVEYQLSGVNQVAVKSAIGLTFAAGLRSMLRQAPDVIMVGEIRDQETAQVAIQAALTGHLVLSTLHTNDAASAITRLIDMGIAPFLVASTMQGVLAQRLVRRVCPHCKVTVDATPEERAFMGPPEVAQAIRSNGCDKCRDTGFLGRVGVFELLTVSDMIRRLIVSKRPASAIRQQAVQDGMRTLRRDGATKMREGLTTMTEVLRVVAIGGGDTE